MLVSSHRVYYLNSDMIIDSAGNDLNNRYRKTIRLPSFEEDYTHVSLLHAVIPNSFPAIQQDTNDKFSVYFTLGWDPIENPAPTNPFIPITIKFPEGFYDESQILKRINDEIRKIHYIDFGIYIGDDGEIDPKEKIDIPIIEGSGDLFELDNTDGNQTNHIKVANKMNVLYTVGKPRF